MRGGSESNNFSFKASAIHLYDVRQVGYGGLHTEFLQVYGWNGLVGLWRRWTFVLLKCNPQENSCPWGTIVMAVTNFKGWIPCDDLSFYHPFYLQQLNLFIAMVSHGTGSSHFCAYKSCCLWCLVTTVATVRPIFWDSKFYFGQQSGNSRLVEVVPHM